MLPLFNERKDIMAKLVKYVGPKRQKQVFWLEEKPVWNEGNDFIVELSDKDAAFTLRRCPNIFKVVGVMEKHVISEDKPVEPPPVDAPPLSTVHKVDETKVDEPDQLFGTKAGNPYKTVRAAQMQLNRTSDSLGIDVSELEVVEFSDGCWIKKKEKTDVENMPVIPDDVEMLPAEEGVSA